MNKRTVKKRERVFIQVALHPRFAIPLKNELNNYGCLLLIANYLIYYQILGFKKIFFLDCAVISEIEWFWNKGGRGWDE